MVVLVMGLPGSGKTYFASLLAKKMEAMHYNSDHIRKEVGKWDKYDDMSKLNTYDAMLSKMHEAVQAGKDVVLDATFYKQYLRDKFYNTAEQLNTPLLMIEVRAAEDTIRQRVSKPRADSQADYEVYEKIKAEFEPDEKDHLVLYSDEESTETMISKALNYIRSNDQ